MNTAAVPRRILMTTDTVGGVWHYALELCAGLQPHGISVLLATMGPPPSPEQREAVARLEHVWLCESDYRLEWMDSPWEDVARAGEWLRALEWEFSPDVVHLNGYVHAALRWRSPVLVAGHSCVLSWWKAVRGEEALAPWDRYREAVGAGLRAADLVVAPTRAMLEALRYHYGELPAAAVIANGRRPGAFHRTGQKEPFVLSVGRLWDEAKNATALTAIAPELRWPVRVAGDVSSPDGTARALPGVELLGRCAPAELAQWYARAAIYALPAHYEPFGLSVLEAAFAGCALVLGDIASLRETWAGAAVFVPPRDPMALRDAVNGLIADPVRRHRLAACARQRAALFSSDRMVHRYLDAYTGLLARSRRGAALFA